MIRKYLYIYFIFVLSVVIGVYICREYELVSNEYVFDINFSWRKLFFNNLILYAELIFFGIISFSILFYVLLGINLLILIHNISSGINVYGNKFILIIISHGMFEIFLFVCGIIFMYKYVGYIKKYINNEVSSIKLKKNVDELINVFLTGIVFILIGSLVEKYVTPILWTLYF